MERKLSLGIDIGSTTAKLVLLDGETVLYEKYQRHLSRVRQTTLEMLREMQNKIHIEELSVTVSGSAGMGMADAAELPFVQEVYSPLANNELENFLIREGAEPVVPGLFDFVLFFFYNEIMECDWGVAGAAWATFIGQLLNAAFFLIFGEQNDLYMDFACQCLRVFMGALMTAGASVVIGTFFQAIGKPAQATVLTFLRQIVLFVPTMLLLSLFGDVLKVLWTGPISDGGSCIISVIVLLVCWKKLFKKENVKA